MVENIGTLDATISGSTFRQSRHAISVDVDSRASLVITNSIFEGHETALALAGLTRALTITGGRVSGNASTGISLTNGVCEQLKLRGVTVSGHPASGYGVRIACAAGSMIDLGTLADPGNNIFGDNPGGSVSLEGGAHDVPAVGNTWMPTQGANAEGKYQATGTGGILQVISGTGPNYRVLQGTLRLAQNP